MMEKAAWLERAAPWGDSVLLPDRQRGDRAKIWTSSVVVQHITLINHLNASLSGPLAWTAAQNKEIESHLDQGCRAELTWNECLQLQPQRILIRRSSPSEQTVERHRGGESKLLCMYVHKTYSGSEMYSAPFGFSCIILCCKISSK